MLNLLLISYATELKLLSGRTSRSEQIPVRSKHIDDRVRGIFPAIEDAIRSGSFSRKECPALDCLLPQLLIGAPLRIPRAKLFVNTQTGKKLAVDFDPSDSVYEIKEKIQDLEGILPDHQSLISVCCSGQRLRSTCTAVGKVGTFILTLQLNDANAIISTKELELCAGAAVGISASQEVRNGSEITINASAVDSAGNKLETGQYTWQVEASAPDELYVKAATRRCQPSPSLRACVCTKRVLPQSTPHAITILVNLVVLPDGAQGAALRRALWRAVGRTVVVDGDASRMIEYADEFPHLHKVVALGAHGETAPFDAIRSSGVQPLARLAGVMLGPPSDPQAAQALCGTAAGAVVYETTLVTAFQRRVEELQREVEEKQEEHAAAEAARLEKVQAVEAATAALSRAKNKRKAPSGEPSGLDQATVQERPRQRRRT